MPRFARAHALNALLLLFLLAPSLVTAQYLARPNQSWETLETTSFKVHYPAATRAWVMAIAPKLESYAAAVHEMVGTTPTKRTQVVVEDPSNVANGFAIPLLDGPTVFLWPTPPIPGPSFGSHRGWGEVLTIHEYAHIVHLTFATRSSTERALWRFMPARIGPVARKVPSWVIEGYATFVEGRLTGNGRPNSVGRPAIIRQWALEGQLPRYHELGATEPFYGGSMRYLVGSAFLDWLALRRGEESVKHLWRRLTAIERRSFDEAFRGVYGAAPEELYGAFYTETVEKALTARSDLRAAGIVNGTLIQRLTRATGHPAISKDGNFLAYVTRQARGRSRLVVVSTAAEPVDSSTVWARRRMLERDPLDVAPVDSFPPSKKAIATLHARGERGHENPRWFADGERILVSRDEPLGDGASRPDLFIWNRKSGRIKRVTSGAGIRTADPSPDGKWAAAVRCASGICDLVRVDLERGRLTTIAAGSPKDVWYRPRVSTDGQHVAATLQRNGRWHAAIVDLSSNAVQVIGGGSDNRYDVSWGTDGTLVGISEQGGVANIELYDPRSQTGTIVSRVTGAAMAPEVGPDGRIWFLDMHARGFDLRRIPAGAPVQRIVTLDPRLTPAAPKTPDVGRTFADVPVNAPHAYTLGSPGWRLLPGGTYGPDGQMWLLSLTTIDPIARWSTVIQGGQGSKAAWRGGSASSSLRTRPIQLDGSVWYTEQNPAEQINAPFASVDLDARYTGLGVGARFARQKADWGAKLRTAGSVGKLNAPQLDDRSRALGFAELDLRLTWPLRTVTITPHGSVHYAKGNTAGDSWTRQIVTAALTVGTSKTYLRVEGVRGNVTEAERGDFGLDYEQFTVGGGALPFLDRSIMSQRIEVPSVPVGFATGSKYESLRASLRMRGLTPYAMWLAAGDSIGTYQKIAGIENDFDFPAIGFVKLPATHIRFGLGYSFDQPFAEKIRPYVSVTFKP